MRLKQPHQDIELTNVSPNYSHKSNIFIVFNFSVLYIWLRVFKLHYFKEDIEISKSPQSAIVTQEQYGSKC